MIFRYINYNDYEEYKQLINSNISKENYNDFLDNILNNNHLIIVLEENNNIIGTGTLWIEPKMTYGGCKMGHIENIIININHRKKGLGEKLVNHLLKISKDKKCYRVDLNCNTELENFYKKNNFNKNQISMNILFKENFSN